jgi:hypothetical protein
VTSAFPDSGKKPDIAQAIPDQLTTCKRMYKKTRGYFKPHLASLATGSFVASSSPRSRGSHLAEQLLVCVVVGFGKLTGYVVVETALDELFLEDTSHVTYVISDTDWKPKEAWKYSQDVVS